MPNNSETELIDFVKSINAPFYELPKDTLGKLVRTIAQLITFRNMPPLVNYRLAVHDLEISFDFLDHLDLFSRHYLVEQASLLLMAPQHSIFRADTSKQSIKESASNGFILETFESQAKEIIMQFANALLNENEQVTSPESDQSFIYKLQMKIIDTIYTETNTRYLKNIIESISVYSSTITNTAVTIETFIEYYSCLLNSLTDFELMAFYSELLKPILRKTSKTGAKKTSCNNEKSEKQYFNKFLCYSSDESE